MKNIEELEQLSKLIKKQFGQESIRILGREEILKVNSLSTGCFGLDYALGIGGIPEGRIVELYGDVSTGKTTICLNLLKNAQKKGIIPFFVDAEHALDLNYGKKLGVDWDGILISQPDTLEETLDIVSTCVEEAEKPMLVVIDTIVALVPRRELEGGMSKETMGLQASKFSTWLKRIAGSVSRTKSYLVCTNQLRERIGQFWGDPSYSPGGKALKFYTSQRIELKQRQRIKQGNEVIGNTIKARVIKNKLASPFKETQFDIVFGKGINNKKSIIDVALSKKIVDKSGSFYVFKNIEAKGMNRFISKLSPKDYKSMRKLIKKAK